MKIEHHQLINDNLNQDICNVEIKTFDITDFKSNKSNYEENRIFNLYTRFIQNNGKYPTFLIIHPKDYYRLRESKGYSLSSYNEEEKYNGMRIIKTMDMVEGEILVL